MNIKELLVKQSSKHPEKRAIVFEDKQITFPQLKSNSFKIANYLLSKGINKSDKVATFLPNTPEVIFSQLGIFSIGAALVPLDFMLTQEEIINFIRHSECKALIIQPKKDIDLENIKKKCPTLKEIVIYRGQEANCTSLEDILQNGSDEAPSLQIDDADLSSIFYTSGSTGHPKGVMLTYKHFDNPVKTIDHFLKVSNEDVFLCGGVPFSHVGGLDYILLMLYFSSTLILMERFHPLEFIKNIGQHKVTIFCIVPAMYVAILSLKDYEKFDLSSLRYAVVFGAPSSPILLKKFHKVCPNAFLSNGWGMTETAAPNCMVAPGIERIDSIGNFAPWMQAKIVDDSGSSLGPDEQGELWVRGEAVMTGYYKEKELTDQVLTEDGWLKTGDIAKFDKDGLCFIVGRKKDMIKVAGEIVFSSEVEEKIQRHPKIKEVAIIGVSDKLRGEVPKAFLVLEQGGELDIQELKDFLRDHLAHFKIPHHFEFIETLPKNRTGKIDKQALKRIHEQ